MIHKLAHMIALCTFVLSAGVYAQENTAPKERVESTIQQKKTPTQTETNKTTQVNVTSKINSYEY